MGTCQARSGFEVARAGGGCDCGPLCSAGGHGTLPRRFGLGAGVTARTMPVMALTTTRIRLPPATETFAYDRPQAKVSHLRSNHSASRRK